MIWLNDQLNDLAMAGLPTLVLLVASSVCLSVFLDLLNTSVFSEY